MAIDSPPLRKEVIVEESGLFTHNWGQWFQNLYKILNPGVTAVITTAPITGGGTPGSMTFVNGVLVDQTPAT